METAYKQIAQMPFVPKWLGDPMYPDGFPMPPESVFVESRSIQMRLIEYYEVCIREEGGLVENPPLNDDELQVLRQWVVYYLHAPIWQQMPAPGFAELQERSFGIATWQELHDVSFDALDFGLDPLS